MLQLYLHQAPPPCHKGEKGAGEVNLEAQAPGIPIIRPSTGRGLTSLLVSLLALLARRGLGAALLLATLSQGVQRGWQDVPVVGHKQGPQPLCQGDNQREERRPACLW